MRQKCTKKGSLNEIWTGFGSFHSQMFFKIGVSKNFANYTGEHLCWRHFLIKLQTWRLFKERLQHRCFPVKLAKFLRISFLTDELQWLPLTFNSYFQRTRKQKPVRLSLINIRYSCKKVSAVTNVSTWVRKIGFLSFYFRILRFLILPWRHG